MTSRALRRIALAISLALWLAALGACKESPLDKAKGAMERGDFTAAIQWYMDALKAAPQDKAARAGLADARLRYAKQFAIDAVRGAHNSPVDWERLLEHLEQEGDAVKMELLDAYYNLAEIYRKSGERDKTLDVLMKAIAADPSRRIPLGKINDLVKESKDAAWGKKAFEALTAKFPDDQEVCAKHGTFLGARDLWDEAIERYRRCLELNPGDFSYNNQIRMEIVTLEKRKRVRSDRTSPQPGAME